METHAVKVRNIKSLKWDLIGTVSKEIPGEDNKIRTYEIELNDGNFLVRNGRYVHHRTTAVPGTSTGEDLATESGPAPRLDGEIAAGPVTRLAAARATANLTQTSSVGLDNASQPACLPETGCVEQQTGLPTSV